MTTTNQMTVTLKDHMGSDLSVVNAARVSFAKESASIIHNDAEQVDYLLDYQARKPEAYARREATAYFGAWAGMDYPKINFEDYSLIRYLAKHNHWTPFGHTSVTLHVKAPIFIARQLGKHQVGLVWNEVSRRYVDDEPEFYVPEAWRKRPANGIKQGSSDETVSRWSEQFDMLLDNARDDETTQITLDYDEVINICKAQYARLLDLGVAPEMARMVLPQSMMTEWYWTGSIAAFARVYKLRSEETAQREVQEIASQIDSAISPHFPVSWATLTES